MRYRPLGKTGLQVSEIGFGAWGIGGRTVEQTSYGDTDDRTSLAALDRALSIFKEIPGGILLQQDRLAGERPAWRLPCHSPTGPK